MFDPTVTAQQIFGIDFPEVWETQADKPIVIKLVGGIAVDRARLLQAFISNNYKSVDNGVRMVGFNRDAYDIFLEAAQLDSETMIRIPAKTLEHHETAGWIAMAGEVPGLLVFPIHSLIDYQKKVFGMYPEPDENDEKYDEKMKELEPPMFLHGSFIPIPSNLMSYIDPERKYFSNYIKANPDLPEVVINFAKFYHEIPEDDE